MPDLFVAELLMKPRGKDSAPQRLDVSVYVARIGSAFPSVEGMRAQADSDIWMPGPVTQVVAALASRTREVTDLVLSKASLRQPVDGQVIHLHGALIGRERALSGMNLCFEGAPLLQIEYVKGEVVDGSIEQHVE